MKLLFTALCVIVWFGVAFSANHSVTNLPITSTGWTDFETIVAGSAYSSARVVFVSTDGNDGTAQTYGVGDVTFDSDGIFQAPSGVAPYATITAAKATLRNNSPDIMLLKRGDTWSELIGTVSTSGASAAARAIIASYGSTGGRPTVTITGSDGGISTDSVGNLIVSGIRFYASSSERALNSGGTASNQLFEDCLFENTNFVLQGDNQVPPQDYFSDFAFRRNVFTEGGSHFVMAGDGFLYEENVSSKPLTQGRHLYLSAEGTQEAKTLTNVILRGNIIRSSADSGISYRCDGLIDNNLILQLDQVWAGGRGGTGPGGWPDSLGSVDRFYKIDVTDNVFLESVPESNGAGEHGLWMGNPDGSIISGNIFADPTGYTGDAYSINFDGGSNVNELKNVTVENNIIYDRKSPTAETSGIYVIATLTNIENVSITNNDIQMPNGADRLINIRPSEREGGDLAGFTFTGNRYYNADSVWFVPGTSYNNWLSLSGETGSSNTQISYTDPNRTIGTYNASIGGTASTAAFMNEAVLQSRHNWRNAYRAETVNNYIRAGFDMDPVAVEYTGDDPPTISAPSGFRVGGGFTWQ